MTPITPIPNDKISETHTWREWLRTLSNYTFLGKTATTVGAAGSASVLPATPTGYTYIKINGTEYKIPYYNS